MTATRQSKSSPGRQIKDWLLQSDLKDSKGQEKSEEEHAQPWWKVMCLTGVDYFSTLGYQPGIAALAAGVFAPLATGVLILLTLFGALPIYERVAEESPHGEGSIFMLERLLSWWTGKIFVLCLLGFVATDFIITITLSAADATAHIVENPYTPVFLHHHNVAITLALISLLTAIFLKGFKEAIGIAVVLVVVYLGLNAVVVGAGVLRIVQHPHFIIAWKQALLLRQSNPFLIVGISLLLFPKLALGLSGFETGVAVMPHVKGDKGGEDIEGRIRNTRKLLLTAAIIMSVFLISSCIVTITLIPAEEFRAAKGSVPAGSANGRALAYLAHRFFGHGFGTVYDFSTITILWFAGASAMAGLLNIVPRYLPRYGMAPEWTRASRPLVLVYTAIAFLVTFVFKANVDAQGGAYATGVLVLMSSAAVAVSLSAWHRQKKVQAALFGIITCVFLYTTIVNVIERPDGIKIASLFIFGIILTSFASRVVRSFELRVDKIDLDDAAKKYIEEAARGAIQIIANKRQGFAHEYSEKNASQRVNNCIPEQDSVLFLEVEVGDASRFVDSVQVRGVEEEGYRILRAHGAAVPNAIAAILLHIRDDTGKIPHAYFSWSEGNPILFLIRYIVFGEGDTAPVTHEVLRQAEPDPAKRPSIHVGGER